VFRTRKAALNYRPAAVAATSLRGFAISVERPISLACLRNLNFTRNGYDWTKRFPWIVAAALKNRSKQFVIDGEAVILGVDGISNFNALQSNRQNEEVQLYAFDVMAINGEDLRDLPLSMRKAILEKLLRGRPDGMFIAPFEQGEIGPDLLRAPAISNWRVWGRSAPIAVTAADARWIG
jgi:hypothetical protein